MPITILGNDVHSKSAQTNYLIWHSNGKVYSVSENRVGNIAAVSGTSPPTTLPATVAAPAEPVPEPSSVESPAPAGQETGAPFGYPLAATIGAALVVLAAIGMVVGRSVLAARSEAR